MCAPTNDVDVNVSLFGCFYLLMLYLSTKNTFIPKYLREQRKGYGVIHTTLDLSKEVRSYKRYLK